MGGTHDALRLGAEAEAKRQIARQRALTLSHASVAVLGVSAAVTPPVRRILFSTDEKKRGRGEDGRTVPLLTYLGRAGLEHHLRERDAGAHQLSARRRLLLVRRGQRPLVVRPAEGAVEEQRRQGRPPSPVVFLSGGGGGDGADRRFCWDGSRRIPCLAARPFQPSGPIACIRAP